MAKYEVEEMESAPLSEVVANSDQEAADQWAKSGYGPGAYVSKGREVGDRIYFDVFDHRGENVDGLLVRNLDA